MKISIKNYTYILPWQKEHVWFDLCEKHDGQMGLLEQRLHCIILSAPLVDNQQIQQEFAPSTSYTSFAPSTSYTPGSGLISIRAVTCSCNTKKGRYDSRASRLFWNFQRFNLLFWDKEDYGNEKWWDKQIIELFLLLPRAFSCPSASTIKDKRA